MLEKEIHRRYFSQIYYFTFHYIKDEERAQEMVADAFVILFSGIIPDNAPDYENAVKDFLYNQVEDSCVNYYVEDLGIKAPDQGDLFNTRLDAELLALHHDKIMKNGH